MDVFVFGFCFTLGVVKEVVKDGSFDGFEGKFEIVLAFWGLYESV